MEYRLEVDDLSLTVNAKPNQCLQLLVISDHDTVVYTVDGNENHRKQNIFSYFPWNFRFLGGILTSMKAEGGTVGMIIISRDEIIMRLPECDYGLEFTSALPVDLKIGDNHITGLQGTIPVKAAAFPFDQRGQTVGTQVNAVTVKGSGNVIGNLNIVNGDFVKGR